jgi:hypothetical protein
VGLHRFTRDPQCLAIDGQYRQRPFYAVSVIITVPDGFGRTSRACDNLKGES